MVYFSFGILEREYHQRWRSRVVCVESLWSPFCFFTCSAFLCHFPLYNSLHLRRSALKNMILEPAKTSLKPMKTSCKSILQNGFCTSLLHLLYPPSLHLSYSALGRTKSGVNSSSSCLPSEALFFTSVTFLIRCLCL